MVIHNLCLNHKNQIFQISNQIKNKDAIPDVKRPKKLKKNKSIRSKPPTRQLAPTTSSVISFKVISQDPTTTDLYSMFEANRSPALEQLKKKKILDDKHKDATDRYLRINGLLKDDPKDLKVDFHKIVIYWILRLEYVQTEFL